jgi:hypothetical protein
MDDGQQMHTNFSWVDAPSFRRRQCKSRALILSKMLGSIVPHDGTRHPFVDEWCTVRAPAAHRTSTQLIVVAHTHLTVIHACGVQWHWLSQKHTLLQRARQGYRAWSARWRSNLRPPVRQLPSGCRGVMAATGVAPYVHAGEHVIWCMVPCQRPLTPCPPAEPCIHGTDDLLGGISHYSTRNCTRALSFKDTTGGAGGDCASHTSPDPVCAPLCTTGAHTVGGPCGRGQDAQ